MELSDNQLIKLIRAGDSGSFAVLVERYQVRIFNLMYRFSQSVEEATDLTQDVFCRAYEKLGRYREQQHFFPWLYTMALNHARDWKRKRRTQQRTIGDCRAETEAVHHTPDSDLESKQRVDGLHWALQRLPEDRREMVILRYRHDCSIRELAELFELSESAVKMRLQRSLAELGRSMEQRGHG